MNLNFNTKRTRWDSQSYSPSLVSTGNENSNRLFIDTLIANGFFDVQKYPNLKLCYTKLIDFLNLQPKSVIFGFGSDQLLKDLFMTLEYDSIQIFDHSWAMAEVYNTIFKKTVIINRFSFDNGFYPRTPEELGGDVLYAVSPHCPTGFELDVEKAAAKFKYVILDETYKNPLRFNHYNLDNVIVVRSFSKLGGVPGIRIGYCVANENIIDRLFVVKPMYELSTQAVRYVDFIVGQVGLAMIDSHQKELNRCFEILQKVNGGFGVHKGNFGTFQDVGKLKGKRYVIDSVPFVRTTLTNTGNVHLLMS